MRIAFINGSPKAGKSASAWMLNTMQLHIKSEIALRYLAGNALEGEFKSAKIHFRTAEKPTDAQLKDLDSADIWIFAFPLYVDGVPGHLLSCLMSLEQAALQNPQRRIYGICNCGFYEGEQNEPALDVLRNWSEKCGYIWGGGIGVGGGGATLSLAGMGKVGQVLMKPVDMALMDLGETISTGKTQENTYVSIALPRAIYQFCAHDGWKKKIKANGGKVSDLERRL